MNNDTDQQWQILLLLCSDKQDLFQITLVILTQPTLFYILSVGMANATGTQYTLIIHHVSSRTPTSK